MIAARWSADSWIINRELKPSFEYSKPKGYLTLHYPCVRDHSDGFSVNVDRPRRWMDPLGTIIEHVVRLVSNVDRRGHSVN